VTLIDEFDTGAAKRRATPDSHEVHRFAHRLGARRFAIAARG